MNESFVHILYRLTVMEFRNSPPVYKCCNSRELIKLLAFLYNYIDFTQTINDSFYQYESFGHFKNPHELLLMGQAI